MTNLNINSAYNVAFTATDVNSVQMFSDGLQQRGNEKQPRSA